MSLMERLCSPNKGVTTVAKTYIAKRVATAKFFNENSKETMIVAATEGKSGFNLKISVKNDKSVRALTGGRQRFDTRDLVMDAFNTTVAQAEEKKSGWKRVQMAASKNAFMGIPKPGSLNHITDPAMAPRLNRKKKEAKA